MRIVSLFSGCGGFDLGYRALGFEVIAGYDSDPAAVDVYNENGVGQASCVDLRTGIPNEHRLKDVDVLIAGPPCQGFSTAGKRDLDDHRNSLLTLTGQLALRVRPKVLVVENVTGALSGHHIKYWNALCDMLRESDYKTHTIRCETATLGMAQQRRRVLLFAWRTGSESSFDYQTVAPSTLREALKRMQGLKNHHPNLLAEGSKDWLIAKRILPGQKLSNVRGGDKAVATWEIPEVFGRVSANERTVLEMLRRLRRQKRTRDYGDADPVSVERLEAALGKKFAILVEQLIYKGYLRRTQTGIDLVGTFNGKYRRMRWDAPACTVDTRFGSARYFLHPSSNRGFTVREAARIQGFPDAFNFTGNSTTDFRLIGNAVPPPLAAFAAKLSTRLLGLSR